MAPDLRLEFLEAAAEELTGIGLSNVAAIVRAEAQKRPSDVIDNPYPTGSLDAKVWLESWHLQARRRLGLRG